MSRQSCAGGGESGSGEVKKSTRVGSGRVVGSVQPNGSKASDITEKGSFGDGRNRGGEDRSGVEGFEIMGGGGAGGIKKMRMQNDTWHRAGGTVAGVIMTGITYKRTAVGAIGARVDALLHIERQRNTSRCQSYSRSCHRRHHAHPSLTC